LESVLGVLQREAGSKLCELTRTRLLHSLDELGGSERRCALLKSGELSGLRDNRLETESRLDVGDVLLLGALTLLLRGHLAREGLLLGGIPLASGGEDVLERLLRLSIGDIAGRLARLKQAHGLSPALHVRVGNGLADGTGLAEGLDVAQCGTRGSSTGSNGLLSSADERGISGSGLSETGGDLALKVGADPLRFTDILGSGRNPYLLVPRSFDLILRDGALTDVLEERLVESVPGRIKSLKLRSALHRRCLSKGWSAWGNPLLGRFVLGASLLRSHLG
jgi:hypothetical protein